MGGLNPWTNADIRSSCRPLRPSTVTITQSLCGHAKVAGWLTGNRPATLGGPQDQQFASMLKSMSANEC